MESRKILDLLQEAFNELDSQNRLCDEFNCICQNQYKNCPYKE